MWCAVLVFWYTEHLQNTFDFDLVEPQCLLSHVWYVPLVLCGKLFFLYSNWSIIYCSSAEDEPFKVKEAVNTEADSKHAEIVAPPLPVRPNHNAWADDALRQQPHPPPAPPPPSAPPPQVPIAVIPMVPVVNAAPSFPPLPVTTPIAAAATSLSSPLPLKNESPSTPPQQQQQLVSHHLLGPSQIKMEPAQQLIDIKAGLSQPQVQIQYQASISTNGSGSHHVLVPHQAPPTPQSRPNGVTLEDMRGMEGKRRPGGSV